MSLPSAGQIIERLEGIDQDLGTMRGMIETAAHDYHHAKRDWEFEQARIRTEKKHAASDPTKRPPTQSDLDAAVLLELAKSDTYKEFIVAEAGYEGAKAAMRILETRASVGQSVLRVLAKEAGLQ